ncbi:ATP-binding protein [Streptomyces sp. NPDC048638]|uniref:ATP-binding protein n=1 Tax=Streptomyces sp. NPDC048638 TaxID=3365580 RepID=UPI00371A6E8A
MIVAELAANAALHGRVPGRSFRLTLAVAPPATLRIEVTDTRGDRLPIRTYTAEAPAESGYGLLLVGELADRWGVGDGPVPCRPGRNSTSMPDAERRTGARKRGIR